MLLKMKKVGNNGQRFGRSQFDGRISQGRHVPALIFFQTVILMAVVVQALAGANYVWSGGAACPTASGMTLFTDCTRLILHDPYHDYTQMCRLTAAENGCIIADRTIKEPVEVLGFVDYTPGHGRTVSSLIAHVRIIGTPEDLYVYTDALYGTR
jgi:hypothetical protein